MYAFAADQLRFPFPLRFPIEQFVCIHLERNLRSLAEEANPNEERIFLPYLEGRRFHYEQERADNRIHF